MFNAKVHFDSNGELEKFLAQIRGGAVAGVKVGIVEGATSEEGGVPVEEYAGYNEFGTNRIPSRPFLRKTIEKRKEYWGKLFAAGIKKNGMDIVKGIREGFTLIGSVGRADVQETIKSNMPPPNNPAYLMWKVKHRKGGGYIGTLFKTGTMHNSVNYELTDANGKTAK